jgi:hypothetical protein
MFNFWILERLCVFESNFLTKFQPINNSQNKIFSQAIIYLKEIIVNQIEEKDLLFDSLSLLSIEFETYLEKMNNLINNFMNNKIFIFSFTESIFYFPHEKIYCINNRYENKSKKEQIFYLAILLHNQFDYQIRKNFEMMCDDEKLYYSSIKVNFWSEDDIVDKIFLDFPWEYVKNLMKIKSFFIILITLEIHSALGRYKLKKP